MCPFIICSVQTVTIDLPDIIVNCKLNEHWIEKKINHDKGENNSSNKYP